MSVLNKIAFYQNRRDDVPNQALARELAAKKDRAAVGEIARHLWDKDRRVQSDCLKVLYEIGYLDPALIADYADSFLKLLKSANNRLVWGSMAALSSLASLRADLLYRRLDDIAAAMEDGSVITRDHGMRVLAAVAASGETRRQTVFPRLLKHLAQCRPKDVPQYAESIRLAVAAGNRDEFVKVLQARMADLSNSQAARVRKVIRETPPSSS